MAYLELRKVSFAYYTQNSKTSILEDASFIFPNIGLVCIEGESGSGKSTVLNLLANYIKPNKGNIVKNYNDEEVGFVFQDFHLIDHLNVIENILLPKIVNGSLKKDGYNQAKKLLSTINLSNLENRKISELSYGQQARISLVRGLIGNKKVLLLDEPTANLDVENSIQIMEIIKEISKTKLVILVTHNKSLSQKYSDYIVHIENKKLICNKIIQNRESNKILTKKQLAKVKLKESLFLAYSFFKTRILKVSLSLVFISICFSIVSVLVNLSFNSKSQLQTYLSNNFDYNLLEIQEKKEYELDNQEMSLIKMDKLSFESENILKSYFPDIEIYLTLEYFIPGVNYIKSNSEYIDEKIYFCPCFPSENKLAEGDIPKSYFDVVVNRDFLEILNLNNYSKSGLLFQHSLQIKSYYASNEVIDKLDISINFNIVGISKEENLIFKPTIYYSYPLMRDYLFNKKLDNLTQILDMNKDINLKYRLEMLTYENDPLMCFKNLIYVENPILFQDEINLKFADIFSISSYSLEQLSSLEDMLSSLSFLVFMFIGLAVVSSFFLELVVIENFYKEKQVELGLYLSFYVSKQNYFRLGFGQIILMFLVSIIGTFLLRSILYIVVNKLFSIYKIPLSITSLPNIVELIIILIVNFLFCYFCSYLPLKRTYTNQLILSLKGE